MNYSDSVFTSNLRVISVSTLGNEPRKKLFKKVECYYQTVRYKMVCWSDTFLATDIYG
jgi:hypothetical protein